MYKYPGVHVCAQEKEAGKNAKKKNLYFSNFFADPNNLR